MPKLARAFRASLRRFVRARSGSIGIIFGIAAVPALLAFGLGIDYVAASRVRTVLNAAADAAALAAVTTAANVMTTATSGYDPTAAAISQGEAQGQQFFAANTQNVTQSSVSSTTTVTKSGKVLTATTTYTATWRNAFGPLIGLTTTNLSSSATSSTTIVQYVRIYVLVDNSQSMGIGSTASDMAALYTQTGCVFGCHLVETGQTGTLTYEQIAHLNNITLRIDAVKSALSTMVSNANVVNAGIPTVSIGIYTIEVNLTTLAAPTTSNATLTSAVSNLDLGSQTDSNSSGDSYMFLGIPDLTAVMGANGDGSSPSTPINYVVIITDGTYDFMSSVCLGGRCTGPFYSSWCPQLQAKATVGVIYTTYPPIYNNNNASQGYNSLYQTYVLPNTSQIIPNLQACATSSSWYFQASDGPSMTTALNTMFGTVFGQASPGPRLTQ